MTKSSSTIGALRTVEGRSMEREPRRRRVEYVDSRYEWHLVHFSRFLVYMENTEHAFLRADRDRRPISRTKGWHLWPRRRSLRLSGPAARRRAGDRPSGIGKGTRSLTYGFRSRATARRWPRAFDLRLLCIDDRGNQGDPIPRDRRENRGSAPRRGGLTGRIGLEPGRGIRRSVVAGGRPSYRYDGPS